MSDSSFDFPYGIGLPINKHQFFGYRQPGRTSLGFSFMGCFDRKFLLSIYRKTDGTDRLPGSNGRRLSFQFFGFFCCCSGNPYVPERVPGMSHLHVEISFMAPVLLGLSQIRFLLFLQKKMNERFLTQWLLLAFLGFGSAFLFLSIGIVSSLLEIFLILGICFYLLLLHHKLKKMMCFV